MSSFNFDYSIFDEKKEGAVEPSTAEKYFPSIYKLFDEDKVPNFIKEGYNRSIEGLAYQAMTGKKFYDVGNYTPGHLADIGATIVSFVATPTDLASMVLGGAIGRAALQPLMTKAAGYMFKAGVPKAMVTKAIQSGTKATLAKNSGVMLSEETAKLLARDASGVSNLARAYGANLGASVGGLGFYSGLQSAAIQTVEQDDVNALKVLYDATKGGLTAFGAQTAAAGLTPSIISKLGLKGRFAEQAAVKGVEAGVFGTSGAVYETLEGRPRLPHLSDYTHAIGVIGALSVPGAAKAIRTSSRLKKVTQKDIETYGREAVELDLKAQEKLDPVKFDETSTAGRRKKGETKLNEVLLGDKTRVFMFSKDWRLKGADNKIDILVDLKGDTNLQNGRQSIVKKDFLKAIEGNKIKESYFTDFGTQSNPKIIGMQLPSANKYETTKQKQRLSEAELLSKELGQSKEEFNLIKKKYEGTGNLGIMSSKQILKHYRYENAVNTFLQTTGKTDAFKRTVAYYKFPSPLAKLLPEKAYDALVRLKPVEDRYLHPSKYFAIKRFQSFQADFQRFRNEYLSPFKLNGEYQSIIGKAGIYDLKGKKGKQESGLAYDVMRKDVIGKDGKVYKGGRNLDKGVEFQFLDAAGNPTGQSFKFEIFSPKLYRTAMDSVYKLHQASGIKVEKYLESYLPNMFSKKALDVLQGNILKIADKLGKSPAEFRELMQVKNKTANQQTKDRIQGLITEYLNAPKTDPMFREAMRILTNIAEKNNVSNPQIQAFQRLSDIFYTERLGKRNPFLEKSRKFEIPEKLLKLEGFMEKDIAHISGVYFNKSAERIASAKNFGPKEEYITGAATALTNIGREADAKLLIQAHQAATGKIEYDPKYNWDINTKNLLNDMTNIQVATKIGLGFSVIPNMSQTFISTALKTGYGPILNGWLKYKTQPEYKKLVDSMAFDYKEIFNAGFGTDVGSRSATGKFAQFTLERNLGVGFIKNLSFNKINEINFKTSQIGAIEYLRKQQDILNNKGIEGLRGKAFQRYRNKAIEELRNAGINKDTNINLSKEKGKTASKDTLKKLQTYSFNFAKDYQLQRNVLKDPLFMNDPRWRPFTLFKRFGYRQFTLLQRIMREEAKTNPEVILRLGVAGVAGSAFVLPAREMLSDLFSGENIMSTDYTIPQIISQSSKESPKEAIKQIRFDDIVNSLAAVGAAGMVGDMLASESPTRLMDQLKFQLTPVMIDNLNDIFTLTQKFLEDVPEFGIAGATRRTPKNIAPIIGGVGTRLGKRLETDRQRAGRIKSIKSRTVSDVLDLLIAKDTVAAKRLIRQYNESYGYVNPITFDNVSYDKVSKKYINKLIKRKYPNLNI